MKSFYNALALVVSANALSLKRNSCCFGISGDGTLGQLSDGQNRFGVCAVSAKMKNMHSTYDNREV